MFGIVNSVSDNFFQGRDCLYYKECHSEDQERFHIASFFWFRCYREVVVKRGGTRSTHQSIVGSTLSLDTPEFKH